jgi:multidrug efflux system membrane fusion protein
VGGLALLAACSGEKANGKTGPPPGVPVTAATVEQRAVPVQVQAIGNVQAVASVTILSQVDGQVFRVHFAEGQDVKKGDLLFTLDQRPFEASLQQAEATLARDVAQLKQAEANLAKDQAQLATAKVQTRRYKELIDDGAVSSEQYDAVRTTAETFEAAVQADGAAVENAKAVIKADQAVVENARIQLGYTAIRAPMEGRTGNLLVHEGNAVKARDQAGAMVVINQIHPIYVGFAVPEQYLPDITKYRAAGTLKVEAVPPGQEQGPARGELTFINNTVDPSTGTIQIKATFANADNRLWPGQFLNVVLTLTTEPNAVVVPSQAIQTGQQGSYVFVIKPDLTVETRPVVPGLPVGNETVVQKGLAPGERVVTEGQIRLVPGVKVDVKPPTSAPVSPEKAG